ncbi:MAG: protein kinase domain-containing protein [Planctomycetota bacterium]|jgi:serine/threonine protein kinase
MGVCLSHELVERYITGSCSDDEQNAVETHLTQCENCRQVVKSAQSNITASGQSDPVYADKATVGVTEEINGNRDEYPTKSMPEVSTPPPEQHTFEKEFDLMLEGYQILEELPRGGQAVVYKVIQKATKRVAAVKVLLQGSYASARARYRFEREVDLAASLQHPNIVTIYDSGITRGQYYFAMEYIQGKALDEYVRTEELSIRETMEIFNKVCSAVVYAHAHGVMHRDLKPGNILVDTDGEPHILDFGLAKLTDSSEQVAQDTVMTSIPGKIIGTLAFMSPEQASGQPSAIDVRTDVYSLGMVLYKVLTDKFPYDVNGSMLTILRNIQEMEPVRPSKLVRRFNSEVEAILLKALAKEPSYRYQSAAELQHDAEYWLKGLPITARSDSSIYLLRKLLNKHRYTSTVFALLLLIVVGFSYVSFDLYITAKKAEGEAKAIAEESAAKAARTTDLEQRVLKLRVASFINFLQALDAGRWEQLQYIPRFFRETKGYEREAVAIDFWLGSRPLAEKINEFRQKLEKSEPCFVEFVIAEYYLRKGDRAGAIKAYHKCLSNGAHLKKDPWLAVHAKSRLYELTNENQQDKTTPKVKD